MGRIRLRIRREPSAKVTHLGEHAAQLGFPGAGRAIRLLAAPSDQLAGAHRNAGAVEADIELGVGGGAGVWAACKMRFCSAASHCSTLAAHLLGHSLDFPRFHREPCIAAQIFGACSN